LVCQAPLLATIKSHSDQINSLDFCTKSDRIYLLIASSDCSVSLNDLKGNQIGIFGQEAYWKLETSPSSLRATPSKLMANSSALINQSHTRANLLIPSIEINSSSELGHAGSRLNEHQQQDFSDNETAMTDGEDVEFKVENYKEFCILPEINRKLQVENTFEYESDAFVRDTKLRYNPWSKTILGKTYQESRTSKRERRQPGLIQSEEYIKWDNTGQAPGGLYGSLQILDVDITRNEEKKSDSKRDNKKNANSSTDKHSERMIERKNAVESVYFC
jgi:hypothetical protein